MFVEGLDVIINNKRFKRVLYCSFITFGFYLLYLTNVENGKIDIDQPKLHGLEERRKFRKELLLKSFSEEKVHRTPDAILFGAMKCGTSTLRDFIQLHPQVQCLSSEAHYFDRNINKGLDYYKAILPAVSRYEVLLEKTPIYFESQPSNLPDIINKAVPGVKLILILCNPIDRLFSNHVMGYIKHQPKQYNANIDSVDVNNAFEEKVIEELIPYFHDKMKIDTDELFCPKKFYRDLYICDIRRWIKTFGLKRILILDGEELLHNPGSVILKVQDYLQISRVLKKKDFVRNPVSGMFCIRPWWEENYDFKAEIFKNDSWYENLICMWKGKGVTRSKGSSFGMKNSTREKLKNLYKPYNERLFKLLNRTFDW